MLLLLLLFQQSTAADVQKKLQAKPILKSINSCPDVGYFFQRELVPNAIDPGPCLLCFCKENSSAVCWKRDSSRCDHKKYRHYGKRETRYRRSPGFADIFFRDATRDVLDKRIPEQCKPFESSFSEGCPPTDWCIGCTVCDCDANGRWDCHILSFCPDKKGTKQIQKKKRPYKSKNIKRHNINEQKSNKRVIINKGPPKKVTIKGKTTKTPKKVINKGPAKNTIKRPSDKNKIKSIQTKKVSQIKKTTIKVKKSTTKKAPTNKIIKKKTPTNQNIKINSYKAALQGIKEKNDTYKLAEAIVKKVMSNVEKLMNEQKKLYTITPKTVIKRSMPKRNESKKENDASAEDKLPRKHWIKKVKASTPKPKQPKHYRIRDKRSVDDSLDKNTTLNNFDTTTIKIQLDNEAKLSLLDSSNVTGITTKTHYFRYEINSITLMPDINNNKPFIVNNTIDFSKNIINEANKSLNEPINNKTDSKHLKKIRIITVKHEDLTNTKMKLNDKWKYLQNLLSKEFNKRMYKKYIKKNTNEYNITDYKHRNKSCGKLCTFKTVIKKIIFGFDANSTEIVKARTKKRNLVTTLKNFFKPIIPEIKPRYKKIIPIKNNKSVLNTLCRKFELCDFDLSDKLLQTKLIELSHQTQNILKTISSLKGLLRLLNNTEHTSENDIKDIKELDNILRNLYIMDENNTNITETTRIQIKYVKQNTQQFVKSLEMFAFTLKDIINILQKQNKTSKLSKNILHRDMRCAKHLSTNRNKSTDDRMMKLKKLLLNYNFVQNKFMAKIYDTLTSFERNEDDIKLKVSEKRVSDNSLAIETYSRNIIENLRKLKMLGQKLSSNGRVKREAMGDDDAIEYLLMLMEYLLKQNKPVMNNQVSDGIDLLIDAIKNAPDIKPFNFDATRTTKQIPTRTTDSSENKSFRRADKMKSNKDYSNTKMNALEDTFYAHDKKNNVKGNENIVTPSYYEKTLKENTFETAIMEGDEVINPVQVYFNKNSPELGPDTFLKENIEKNSSNSKYEVYNADDDDDENDSIYVTPKKYQKNKEDIFLKTKIDKGKGYEKIQNHVNLEVANEINTEKNNKEPTSKPDWEFENIDSDRQLRTTTKVTLRPLQVTRTSRRHKDKYANPISGISSEEIDNSKKQDTLQNKLKKIDIFGSFDYNTERTDVDSDSKEDKNYAFSDFA